MSVRSTLNFGEFAAVIYGCARGNSFREPASRAVIETDRSLTCGVLVRRGIPVRTAGLRLSTAVPYRLLECCAHALCELDVTLFCRHPEYTRSEAPVRRRDRVAEDVGEPTTTYFSRSHWASSSAITSSKWFREKPPSTSSANHRSPGLHMTADRSGLAVCFR
jgi:hypothetical protein